MNDTKIEPVTAIFDDKSRNWSPDLNINVFFLRQIRNYANDMLKARGHVFLNEIYDQLGMPRTSQGAQVGWIHSNRTTIEFFEDGYIDNDPDAEINWEAIELKFNVDGIIWDKIEEES